MTLKQEDIASLQQAVLLLQKQGFAARLAVLAGKPLDVIGNIIPPLAKRTIASVTYKTLEGALGFAVRSVGNSSAKQSTIAHKALVTASGAASGAFGLMALPIELPISTTIILRSVAEIARSEGEDLRVLENALECLQVFALGGSPERDASEHGYFAARIVLAKSVTDAARLIAGRGAVERSSPIVVQFITSLASRYGPVVTQKIAAQTLPALGAIGGAGLNYAFIDHFQKIARGHFIVRRLEKTYGKDIVQAEYERMSAATSRS